jgi:hypothetical protein
MHRSFIPPATRIYSLIKFIAGGNVLAEDFKSMAYVLAYESYPFGDPFLDRANLPDCPVFIIPPKSLRDIESLTATLNAMLSSSTLEY